MSKQQLSLGQQLAALRWANSTEAERKAVGRKITDARLKKQREAKAQGTRRARPVPRRSRKPNKPKPKA